MPINQIALNEERANKVLEVVDPTLVSKSLAVKVVENLPVLDNIVSTDDFYNKCKQIFETSKAQRIIVGSQQHHVRRAQVQNMVAKAFSDNTVNLEDPGTLYSDWFSDRNININDFTTSELESIYISLTREATGLALNNESSLKDLQNAMLKMLKQLTSYSVQVVGNINDSDIIKTDMTAIRIGDIDTTVENELIHPPILSEVSDFTASVNHEIDYKHRVIRNDSFSITLGTSLKLEVPINVSDLAVVDLQVISLPLTKINVKPQTDIPNNTKGIVPVLGIPEYLALSQEEQQSFVSVYTNDYTVRRNTNYIEPNYIDTDYFSPRP